LKTTGRENTAPEFKVMLFYTVHCSSVAGALNTRIFRINYVQVNRSSCLASHFAFWLSPGKLTLFSEDYAKMDRNIPHPTADERGTVCCIAITAPHHLHGSIGSYRTSEAVVQPPIVAWI
jgi:hypothetical protein